MLSLVAYRTQLTHFLAYAAAYALCMVDNALAVMDRYSRTAYLQALLTANALIFVYLERWIVLYIFKKCAWTSLNNNAWFFLGKLFLDNSLCFSHVIWVNDSYALDTK